MKIRTSTQRSTHPLSRKIIVIGLLALVSVSGLARATEADLLVPVSFQGTPIPEARQNFLASQRYAILSREGEPIAFHVRNASPNKVADIILQDSAGGAVADQTVEPGEYDIRFEVPGPGVYFMEYTGENPHWTLTLPEGVSAVLCLEPGEPMNHSGNFGRRYFYVPKGTTEIRFTVESGHLEYSMEVLDPDGTVMQVIDQNQPAKPIPVEAGTDGQVWSFNSKAFAPTFLSFENIPNYLAVSPDALLLPKDLVEKDGL